MNTDEAWDAWVEAERDRNYTARDVFTDAYRAGQIAALTDAAKEIYNSAPDPCQAFYNYGLHPWLMARADELRQPETQLREAQGGSEIVIAEYANQLDAATYVANKTQAERDALQARLDAVTALADEWEVIANHGGSFTPEYRTKELRAALGDTDG